MKSLLRALREEKLNFQGLLFPGLIITNGLPACSNSIADLAIPRPR